MSKNLCRACSYTWHPRGSVVSRVCPNCNSPNVMLIRQTSPLAGFGIVLLIVFGLACVLVAGIVVAVASSSTDAPKAPAPRPAKSLR